MSFMLLKKNVTYSFFNQGFTIPVDKQNLFFNSVAPIKSQGNSEFITIIVDNHSFDVVARNQKFDKNTYPDHKNIVQIRYDTNKDFIEYLRNKFSKSYNQIMYKRSQIDNPGKKYISIPKKYEEYFVLYTTDLHKTLAMDCITSDELINVEKIIKTEDYQEEMVENILDRKDQNANLEIVNRLAKIRKLNQKIGNDLKSIYDYKCQICGYTALDVYSCKIAESHHIKPFINSLNNNADNLMIVCPNHHRIIHKVLPRFIRGKLTFKFPNGLEERLKINYHL
ncbi:MAG: HNH endonuclease [Candidatus Cloacimonetes bacterium]|nr:HNH endonuclease [Candidatus Cloacimonadota bacterium]